MQLQKIGILDDGTLLLPDELRESLKNTSELWMAWNEDPIVINRKFQDESLEIISQQQRIQRFFNTADRLSQFNEVSPISEAEIQAEIEAYRAEKRTRKKVPESESIGSLAPYPLPDLQERKTRDKSRTKLGENFW